MLRLSEGTQKGILIAIVVVLVILVIVLILWGVGVFTKKSEQFGPQFLSADMERRLLMGGNERLRSSDTSNSNVGFAQMPSDPRFLAEHYTAMPGSIAATDEPDPALNRYMGTESMDSGDRLVGDLSSGFDDIGGIGASNYLGYSYNGKPQPDENGWLVATAWDLT